ncbi:unnamed protein product [Dimorphilus gyrociliatus]|uniref:Uncharacterized protein n=1 Tax=Dimorphilus gyrociliatus TaxID=2664684 RepID=A0A7I8WFC7_9ANNE|nr:unnamed protein product [Dimorphilus gyrociliatus]
MTIVLTRIDAIGKTLQLQPQDLNEDSFDATGDLDTNKNYHQSFEIIRGGRKKGKDIQIGVKLYLSQIIAILGETIPMKF